MLPFDPNTSIGSSKTSVLTAWLVNCRSHQPRKGLNSVEWEQRWRSGEGFSLPVGQKPHLIAEYKAFCCVRNTTVCILQIQPLSK